MCEIYGYFDHHPAEEGNPWYESECPDDETIAAISKDVDTKEALAV